MDTRRLSYLRRLGVDCYIPRDAAVLEPEAPLASTAAGDGPARTAVDGHPPERGAAESAVPATSDASATATPEDKTGGQAAAAPEPVAPAAPTGASGDCDGLDWDALAARVAGCQACKLCEGRTQTVFGVGDRQADLVIIGEGPGAEEDRQGEPFVGRAGQLLDAMLAAIDRGRDRGGVYIGNIVKCRPPGNRDPRPDEVAACTPYLRRQLELLEPKAIVALGRVAAQQLLETKAPLAKLRGQLHHYGEQSIPVWVTYHPAYLLRSPGEKAKVWQDLKRIRALVENDSVPKQVG
ncbi:MAG: uracil-DNA glycosylase [Halorhodospira halophila]|uniref:uracil-DNA glycosylase n=1 Tax=Halorhodospira halophila TaxID=1053 RepID=UPI0026F25F67|nr:uracil-DNA glycosylase [Halorhodospira halophila]MCC3751598.1 uracil-DNA glycosylase [Halorhodospira halophila]